jgi:hypothetical protein
MKRFSKGVKGPFLYKNSQFEDKPFSLPRLDFTSIIDYLYSGFVLGGLERVALKKATRFIRPLRLLFSMIQTVI